jgi:hypothetical protein
MRPTLCLAAAAALAATGCAKPFVYAPRAAAAAGPRVPVEVVVLPFSDGTEDFVERIVPGQERRWNLARKGFVDKIGALPPELWSRALADELAASGRFRSARFAYGAADAGRAAWLVEGTLLKAYGPPGEWALALRARRIGDQRPAWERQVSRTFERWDMSQLHPWLNRAMQEMFEEAGADLARTLAGQPAGATGPASGPAQAPSAGAPPVDETIRKILEEK